MAEVGKSDRRGMGVWYARLSSGQEIERGEHEEGGAIVSAASGSRPPS